MVGLINLGAGLAAMGSSIADTGMFAEKNALDNQKLQLASELAGGREHAGRVETGQIQSGLQAQSETFQAGQQEKSQTFQAGEQTEKIGSEEKIAGEQIKANSANIAAQIGAEKTTLQFDSNGNPFTLNEITGKQTPLLDSSGKPLQIINTALVPIAQATVNSNNEQMRAENQTYTGQLNSLNQQMKEAADAATAVTPEDRAKAQKPYQVRIDSLNQQHQTVMDSLKASSAHATASLFTKGAGPQDAKGAPAQGQGSDNRPPLDSFFKPAGGQPAPPTLGP